MPVEGELVAGRYEILALVGTGGMADVHRAHDRVLDRDVAIKTLRVNAAGPSARERFAAEARTLARLNHPGLVTVLDAGIESEHPYLVMELVAGPTLGRRIQQTGPLALDDVRDLGSQLAEALAHAHDNGVIHRDVKPGNILLRPDGRAVLSDFGIAQLLTGTVHHTVTGEVIGSPAYLAPEQVNGQSATAAVDIYALGLVLLEALTGQRAYTGTPIEAAIARLTTQPAIPVSVDRDVRDLLQQMTALDPSDRPGAREVASRLAPLSTSTAILAIDPTAATTMPVAPRPRRRRTGLLVGACLAAVALVAGLAGLAQLSTDDVAASAPPSATPTSTPSPTASHSASIKAVAVRTTAAAPHPRVHAPRTVKKPAKHHAPPKPKKVKKPKGKSRGPGRK